MIGPSRRRRALAPSAEPFQLHRRIARQRTRARRLVTASVAALAVSLGSWLAGADLVWHGALIVAALLAALLIPSPPNGRWALGWIAERIGLSYQTTLETGDRDDPYGLHAAAADRAYKRVRNLDPPRATSWWLPILALAIGMLLLPAASLPGLGGGGGPNGAPPPAPQSGPQEVPEPELPTPETVDPLADSDEPQRADEPAEDDGDDGQSDEELSGDADAEGDDEQQVLDRFLDNLREREPETEDEQQQGGAAPPNVEPTPQPGEPGEGDEQQEGSPQESGGEPQQGGESQGEQGESEGEPGSEQGEQPSEGEQQQEQQGAEGEQGDDATPGGFDPGEQPPGEGAPEGGDTPEGGDDDRGFGAGEQGSEERPSGALDGEPLQEPDFLEGQLGEGPENFGGLIRLPGREEVDLPTEVDPQEYLQAAEEAVTEGDLPVDYQEVIRNYFR